jgi:hypothetical protein
MDSFGFDLDSPGSLIAAATALLVCALAFSASACLLTAPALALCAGVCFASSGRVAYALARQHLATRR